MEVQRIKMAETMLSGMARKRDAAHVEALADSMNRIGLLNPITVMRANYTARGRADNPGFRVLAGGHRYEAAKMLGWEEIDAFVVECSEDDAKSQRMIEITENLHRAELTAGERARLIAEWTELTGEKVRQLDAPAVGGKQPHEQGIRKTARELGLSEPDVRRCMKIASLSPEAQAVAVEEGLDNNRSALLDAAKHQEPEAQVQALLERKAIKMAPAPKDDFEAREAWLDKMLTLWNKASQDWREEFKRRIGEA